jgi:hypothetical protein
MAARDMITDLADLTYPLPEESEEFEDEDEEAGLPVDPRLWVPRAECSQCYQGCADDPKGA